MDGIDDTFAGQYVSYSCLRISETVVVHVEVEEVEGEDNVVVR